ncbi:MAG: TRM11 family methyltransferase [Candidatus Methanoperedens sp.]|jgi:tRNA (guanine10-N2)-dimethyltransferase|nr:TRM11 family methyltransferase [Candidatus Methanoperedens sp.]PKL54352.1 MAG: RNA methyltransferase [Candidatus Methanoperedenaceae archaeon HGW-Methanoperedenaceae-1]
MLLAFELSGEHRTLPESEVVACLESENAGFRVHLSLDGCLVIDLQDGSDRIVNILAERLSMTHNIMRVMEIGGQDENDILDMVEKCGFDPDGTYSIRVRRIKEYSSISTELMEQKIGGIYFRRGCRADLKNPQTRFRLLLTEDKSIFGYIAGSINRSAFEARKPHCKPFFYPGVLMPRVARALVNISKPGKYLLDPFCGTAGVLVEAGLMGINVIGGDVQRKLLLGAKMNLEHYITDFSLMYQDACRLSLKDESIDSVVTDPPYGRSALIEAVSIEHLLEESLKEIYRVLKTGKRAIFISQRPVEDVIKHTGFRIAQMHLQRVHKSLTRHIYVLEK